MWKEPCTAINEQDNKSKKAGKGQTRRLERSSKKAGKDQSRRLEKPSKKVGKIKQEGWKDQARRPEKIKQEGWKRPSKKAINFKRQRLLSRQQIFYKDDSRKQKDDEWETHDRATCDGAYAC